MYGATAVWANGVREGVLGTESGAAGTVEAEGSDRTDEAADLVGRPAKAVGRPATFDISGTCGNGGADSSGSGDADTPGRDVPRVGEGARPLAPGVGCEGVGVPGALPRPVASLRRACA